MAVAVPMLDERQRAAWRRRHSWRAIPTAAAASARPHARYWRAHHTLDQMADAYLALIARGHRRAGAVGRRCRRTCATRGGERLTALLAPFGVEAPAGVARVT